MKYLDGTEVKCGDHIWWNGGSCIGFIATIIEDKVSQKEWGVVGPHIAISIDHPYNPIDPGEVVYENTDFEDEGIMKLIDAEEDDFSKATDELRLRSTLAVPYRVGYDLTKIRSGEWVFGSFESGVYQEIGRVSR